jgi:hypothetical protein
LAIGSSTAAGADCYARRGLTSLDEGFLLQLSAQHSADFVHRRSVIDCLGQVRRDSHEKNHLLLVELAMSTLPSHQYPEYLPVMDQRHAEKTAMFYLPRFRR